MAIKISEFINILENIQREHGDLPVFCSDVGREYDRVDVEADSLRITNTIIYNNETAESRLEIG